MQSPSSSTSSPNKRLKLKPDNIHLLRAEDFEDGRPYYVYKTCFENIQEAFTHHGESMRNFEHIVFGELDMMKTDVDVDTLLVFAMANYVEHILNELLDVREWAISLALGTKQKTDYSKFIDSLNSYDSGDESSVRKPYSSHRTLILTYIFEVH
jgi:hypothetical protein